MRRTAEDSSARFCNRCGKPLSWLTKSTIHAKAQRRKVAKNILPAALRFLAPLRET